MKGGAPCIRGLPITVEEISRRVLDGASSKEILAEHPQLTHDDFMACLIFLAGQPIGEYLR